MLCSVARRARAATAGVLRAPLGVARLFGSSSRSAQVTAAVDTTAPAIGFEATGVRCGIKKKRQ
jgi:hypothetical protein